MDRSMNLVLPAAICVVSTLALVILFGAAIQTDRDYREVALLETMGIFIGGPIMILDLASAFVLFMNLFYPERMT
jgi:sugar phosphate permease